MKWVESRKESNVVGSIRVWLVLRRKREGNRMESGQKARGTDGVQLQGKGLKQ